MNQTGLWILIFGLTITGCRDQSSSGTPTPTQTEYTSNNESISDINKIETLIRGALRWADSNNSINLLPLVADCKNRVYVGFDLGKHKRNINTLKNSNFFATAFIHNYDQIILNLDKRLRSGKYEQWLVGDASPFIFANDVNPWCMCQDVPYDTPNPWDKVDVEVIQLNPTHGELNWKWGNPDQNSESGWREFRYRFKVDKEDGRWKIAYLQGFDFKESLRKD